MASRPSADPRFGRADLSNCEREQVHLAGSIQPHGALLVVEEPSLTVVQASANASAFLGLSGSLIGHRLDQIPGDLAAGIGPHLHLALDRLPMAIRCRIGAGGSSPSTCLLHRPAGRRAGDRARAGRAAGGPVARGGRGTAGHPLLPVPAQPVRGDRAHLPRPHRLRPGDGLPLRRGGPWRGVRRAAAPRPRGLPRQPLSGLGHPADRAAALRDQPHPGAGRRRVHAGAAAADTSCRSPAATSTCPCASCAACRRSTSST